MKSTNNELQQLSIRDSLTNLFNRRYMEQALEQEISRAERNTVRSGDIVCRYGGEEFILIMPGSSLQAAVQRAEKLREIIQAMSLQVNEDTIERITISIGIAICPEHGKSSEDLLRAADIAMYYAKQAGRNRVRIFNPV